MNLYLMRHGQAAGPYWPEADRDRPLTPHGLNLIQAQGRALTQLGLCPDAILHSPLLRTRETATHIAAALGLPQRLSESQTLHPGFNFERLCALLKKYAQYESLFLVGHKADLLDVIHGLTTADVQFPEGAVAYIKVDRRADWPIGELVWLLTSELLATLAPK